MTDKIFIVIFYLFILWMCLGEEACIHHGAFIEVGGQLAKLPYGSLWFSGLTAEPSH